MQRYLSIKELSKLSDELAKVMYKCKCGHKVVIAHNKDKMICSWCGSYVFKDKKREFEYRLKEKIK